MKFRVTFLDGVDLLIEADKEIDAVRKARELKDKLSVANTDYFTGEDLSKYTESYLRNRLEELEKVQPIPKNLSSEWNAIFSELEKRGIIERKDSKISDYNRYENETDKEFLKSAISEMNKYVSNWNFMSEREKKDITGGQGISFLRESLKSAEDRLKKLG